MHTGVQRNGFEMKLSKTRIQFLENKKVLRLFWGCQIEVRSAIIFTYRLLGGVWGNHFTFQGAVAPI